MSPNEIELQNLDKTLDITIEKRTTMTTEQILASSEAECNFVRLLVNTLPILFGRRFRKMEKKGPHTWLRRAVALRQLDNNLDSISHHIVSFCHVTYSWGQASREVASKSILEEQKRRDLALIDIPSATVLSLPPSQIGGDDHLWALGDKALRVIAQNIDSVQSTSWTNEVVKDSKEVQAASQLIVTFIYAFSGLSQTLSASGSDSAGTATPQIVLSSVPHLQRDLTKLWICFISKQLPKFFASHVESIHLMGCNILLAILREGEEQEHPNEDSAIRSWNLDRIVSSRLLGRYSSQAGQNLNLGLVLQEEMVKPREIPAWDSAWVLENRNDVLQMFKMAFSNLGNIQKKFEHPDSGIDQDQVEWIKSEDGYSVLPVGFSNAFRAFLTTLRNAVGQHDSQAQPSEKGVEVVKEILGCVIEMSNAMLIDENWIKELEIEGSRYAVLQFFHELLERCFGGETMRTVSGGISATGMLLSFPYVPGGCTSTNVDLDCRYTHNVCS